MTLNPTRQSNSEAGTSNALSLLQDQYKKPTQTEPRITEAATKSRELSASAMAVEPAVTTAVTTPSIRKGTSKTRPPMAPRSLVWSTCPDWVRSTPLMGQFGTSVTVRLTSIQSTPS